MRLSRFLPLLALTALLVPSCGGDNKEPDKPVADSISIKDASGNAVTSVSVAGGSTTVSLGVTTNFEWTASSSASWAHLSPESGKSGTTGVSVTVEANTATASRSTTLSFKKNGVQKASVTVSQSGAGGEQPVQVKSLKLLNLALHEVTLSENGGVYTIQTTGTDPYLFTENFAEVLTDNHSVLSFDYTVSKAIDDLQLFFCYPMNEERSEHYGAVAASTSWKQMALEVKSPRIKLGWGTSSDCLRLDFGHTSGNTIQIRNLCLRPFTDAEKAAYEQKEGQAAGKEAMATHLDAYLKRNYPATVSSVTVTSDKVTIKGTAPAASGYYLADIAPYENVTEMTSFPVKEALSAASFSITLDRKVTRDGFTYDRALSKWAVVEVSGSKQEIVSHARYADEIPATNPPAALSPKSKKGLGGYFAHSLQRQDLDDLGITSVTVNIVLNNVINTVSDGGFDLSRTYGGKTYYFNSGYIGQLDIMFGDCHKRNIVTEAILLIATAGTSPASAILKHPECTGGNYSMPNMTTAEAVNLYAATIDFLASRYNGDTHGRIHHWILHNEVDFGKEWTNMGDQPELCYMDAYVKSMRLCANIAHQYDPNAAALISITHCWAKADGEYAPKNLLEDLNAYSAAEGDFWWGVAHHPYPQDLFKPAFWSNDTQATWSRNTSYITFRNLEVIDDWIRSSNNKYKGTKKRLLFLSENGTNSPSYADNDLKLQAAGAAWALKKVATLSGIDAIQWHNWWDNPGEGGLHIGLRRNDGKNPSTPKPVWDVYKAAYTADEASVFDPYLTTLGVSDWGSIFHSVE